MRLILVRLLRRVVEYSAFLMKPVCDLLSVWDWYWHGPTYISGHDYRVTEGFDDLRGIGTLRCRRCGVLSEGR